MLHHVEDPCNMANDPLYLDVQEPDLGAYVIIDCPKVPLAICTKE
jgi:hypothetical protein